MHDCVHVWYYFVQINPESITDSPFVLLQHLLQLMQLVQPVPSVLLRAPVIVALEPITHTSYDLEKIFKYAPGIKLTCA